jgi:hypothetical protein
VIDLRAIVERLGGDLRNGGRGANVPGPGHSRRDRSLSIDLTEDGRLLWHSHAGDPDAEVIAHLGLERPRASQERRFTPRPHPTDLRAVSPMHIARVSKPAAPEPSEPALRIWGQAPRAVAGTPVATYLERRGLRLPPGAAGEVIRYHPSCPMGEMRAGCMLALVRHIITNEPQAIHRTALSLDGRKIGAAGRDRMALGPLAGGAIKLSDDGDVETCLGVGEGIETTLSLRQHPAFAAVPVWSLISAGGLERFPVLPGLTGLVIAVDHDPAGLAAAEVLKARYRAAGVEVTTVKARTPRHDLNDLVSHV